MKQIAALAPFDMRGLAVDGERLRRRCAMNGMLKFDIAMFSGHENCRRAPPDARSVDANSYVLSRSMTATRAAGARLLHEIRDGRADDRAADDRDVVARRHHATGNITGLGRRRWSPVTLPSDGDSCCGLAIFCITLGERACPCRACTLPCYAMHGNRRRRESMRANPAGRFTHDIRMERRRL